MFFFFEGWRTTRSTRKATLLPYTTLLRSPGVRRRACTGDEIVDRRKDVRVRQFARYDIRRLGFRPRGVIRFSQRRSDGGRRDRWLAVQKQGIGNTDRKSVV